MGGEQQQKISFAEFELDHTHRRLTRHGAPLPLYAKTFDLLTFLIENNGRVVTKDEILAEVWPDQFVEEANLAVQVSALRKALGEKKDARRFLLTIPGKGYKFVADVRYPGGRSANEIVIERHRVSHISVRESLELTGKAGETGPPPKNSSALRGSVRAILLPAAAFVTVAAVAIVLLGNYFNISFGAGKRVGVPFTNAPVKQLTTRGRVHNAAISPDGRFFAYTVTERSDAKNSLWIKQIEGGNDIQLRGPDESFVRGLAFSPDNQTLYFGAGRWNEEQGGLFRISVFGGVAEKIAENVAVRFSMAPNGRQIAYFRKKTGADGISEALVIANLDGTDAREVLVRPLNLAFTSVIPAWSPDGSLIAFGAIGDSTTQNHEIFVLHLGDGRTEQVTEARWARVASLVWRRDGHGLIGNAISGKENQRQLWHIAYPGGEPTKIAHDTDNFAVPLDLSADGEKLLAVQFHQESNIWTAPADDLANSRQITYTALNGLYAWHGFDWTPDGRIVFTANVDKSAALHIMDGDGGNIRQITSDGFLDRKPAASPDGRFIVFQSNRSGSNEIWRVKNDGTELQQLTNSGNNFAPHITRDGRSVIFISARDGRNFLWRMSIDGGEPVKIFGPVTVDDPRLSPDGGTIACIVRNEAGAPSELVLVSLAGGSVSNRFRTPRTANFNQSIRWSPDGKTVFYRDWVNGIWGQSVAGGPPFRLKGLPEEKFYNFGWSRDGKQFAFSRGREITDVVLISNAE